jgi:hypothetical protein
MQYSNIHTTQLYTPYRDEEEAGSTKAQFIFNLN